MVGEHKDIVAEGRVLAPPATPRLVRPRPADWAEHVSPHDGGADVFGTSAEELVVAPGVAAVFSERRRERGGLVDPVVQQESVLAERLVDALIGPAA
ncbi:MAG: hypothetical protein M1522_04490 [Actinobacteria bacterium]|nr:hypothetical protein [Actinomycetota bacterium]